MNVHLIVRRLTATVLVTKMHLMMLTATVGTVKKWKGYVLTTRVAKSVVGIRTTATVLATKMNLKLGAAQSVKQRLKGILKKREIQVTMNRNDAVLWLFTFVSST